ncbi:MAG: hypothetical protein IID45_06395 [Planctomycetes bacterium]|nr:hypothetical protein [Planctomycetota bacterium]
MKPVALAFVLLLTFAHLQGDWDAAIGRPLSLFRDDGNAWVGFWLFGLLLSAGLLLLWQLIRMKWWLDAAFLLGVAVMLAVVAATPSVDTLHYFTAFLLLFFLYIYFATVFYRCESYWLFVHLILPALLVFVTRLHSYGLWQKSLILYYLFAMVLQHHVCSGWLRSARRSRGGFTPARRDSQRRQKVFDLD